jgi:hypothetical protein
MLWMMIPRLGGSATICNAMQVRPTRLIAVQDVNHQFLPNMGCVPWQSWWLSEVGRLSAGCLILTWMMHDISVSIGPRQPTIPESDTEYSTSHSLDSPEIRSCLPLIMHS